MQLRVIVVAVLVVGPVASVGMASSPNSDELRQRLLAEALPGWAKMHEFVDHSEGVIIGNIVFGGAVAPAQREPIHRKYSFCMNGDLRKIVAEEIPDRGTRKALITNPKYAFETLRDHREGKYYLGDYGERGPERAEIANHMSAILDLPYAGEMLNGSRLAEALGDRKASELTDVDVVLRGERKLVRVALELRSSDGFSSRGWAILDPAYHWSVIECGQEYQAPKAVNGMADVRTVEYHQKGAEVPFPRKIVRTLSSKEGNLLQRDEYILELPKTCNADPSEFTLAAFGLPPVSPKSGVTAGRLLWWEAPVFVLLALFFIIRRFRRGRAHGTNNVPKTDSA